MANIKDVARMAGVSIATVSHVTRGTKYVSESLRNRVNEAIQRLGYEVNPVASGLKSRSTRVIGIVLPNINSVFFPPILKGIEDYASAQGYRLTFCNTDFDVEKEQETIRMLQGSWVDGIILDSVAEVADTDYVRFLSNLSSGEKPIPVVSLERRVDSGVILSVRINNYEGACLAVRHLAECGCCKIVHIAGPDFCSMADDRLRGCRDQLKQCGLGLDKSQVVKGDFSPEQGYTAMLCLLEQNPDLDGVLSANDQMAIGAIRALHESGRRVPEDVKIVGFDNIFVSSLISPSLTTINVPRYQMGHAAAELLIRRLTDPDAELEDVMLPIHLVVRRSTDPSAQTTWDLSSW
ncbi:MAG: LacI family DNA-binding transcriptional regulator [Sedimentisphaerales bacterium]|nr:LacI family DNA-binding transcriptional regulator [Sedimentisphaerales bacterium]